VFLLGPLECFLKASDYLSIIMLNHNTLNDLKAMQSGVNYYVVQDLTLQEAETIALSILKQVMEEKVRNKSNACFAN